VVIAIAPGPPSLFKILAAAAPAKAIYAAPASLNFAQQGSLTTGFVLPSFFSVRLG